MKSLNRTRRSLAGRPDAWLVLLTVAAVLAMHLASSVFVGLEQRFFDVASTAHQRQPSEQVVIVAIDDDSIARIGRWPWPRDLHAQALDQLAQAGVKTVVHTAFFFEPQFDPGLQRLRELRDQLQSPDTQDLTWSGLPPEPRERLLGFIEQAEQELDTDAALANSIQRARNVILPAHYRLGEPLGRPDQPLPAFAQRGALPQVSSFGLQALDGQQPLQVLGEVALGVAHLNQIIDTDGAVRSEALLVNFDGHAIPSMALRAATHSLNLDMDDLRSLPGEAVLLGETRIPTDSRATVLPLFYRAEAGRAPFVVHRFHDVLSGRVAASELAGKTVVIGATATGVGSLLRTPLSTALSGDPVLLSPAGVVAHATSSLLNGHWISRPVWSGPVTLAAIAAVIAYLVLVLPRLPALRGALASLALGSGLLMLGYLWLSQALIWVPLVFPVVLLSVGHLALVTRRFGLTEARKQNTDAESAETNRLMGLALQGQGQLDMAFDRLRRVPHSEPLMNNLQQLALDFERKRHFNKAQSVYEHMSQLDGTQPHIQRQLQRMRKLSQTVALPGAATHPGGNLLLDTAGVENPMLGRYQLEKVLGKGAMGMVYQGRDPKIGRVVAIKTLALSSEFEAQELQEARARFFREAETAGRLQHPNIVTIFDAGEEHDLAYIAMEFLHGQDLSGHSRPDALLPAATALALCARVAQALHYAHQHRVVHRDIKPANIMYEPVSGQLKVTDFGIARITDASRTRTGMVLGTPSFMSPEQLGGMPIDGRSDLYSLGVMLYQLLTGALPFQGESLTALMFNIANQPTPDVRVLRPDLPVQVAELLHQAMAKTPADRFQDGHSMALALEAVASRSPTLALVSPSAREPSGHFDKTELLTLPAHAVGNTGTVITQAVTKVGQLSGDGLEFKL